MDCFFEKKRCMHEKYLREEFIKMFPCEDIFDSTLQHLAVP